MPLFTALFLLLSAQSAFSEIVIHGVEGASNFTLPLGIENEQQTSNRLIIYAGLAGTLINCEANDNGTCNNCNGDLLSCNENRINDGGQLTISFSSTTATGRPILVDSDGGRVDPGPNPNELNVGPGTLTSISIPWNQICGGSCLDATDRNMRIGINTSDDDNLEGQDDSLGVSIRFQGANIQDQASEGFGVFWFTMFPGDEKVFLLVEGDEQYDPSLSSNNNPEPLDFGPGSFPTIDSNTFVALRFYYEEGERCGVPIGNRSPYVRTGITDIGENQLRVDQRAFTGVENDGFQNGTTYVFKVALEDEAGNVGFFTPDISCDDVWHVVTPDVVTGLFEPGINGCFIATATYGQSHKMLQTFYQFRDQKLLPYRLGQIVHRLYYTYSPPLAQKIQENSFLKTIARIILIPFWIYAFLTLQIGHIFTLMLLVGLITFITYFFKRKLHPVWNTRKVHQ